MTYGICYRVFCFVCFSFVQTNDMNKVYLKSSYSLRPGLSYNMWCSIRESLHVRLEFSILNNSWTLNSISRIPFALLYNLDYCLVWTRLTMFSKLNIKLYTSCCLLISGSTPIDELCSLHLIIN